MDDHDPNADDDPFASLLADLAAADADEVQVGQPAATPVPNDREVDAAVFSALLTDLAEERAPTPAPAPPTDFATLTLDDDGHATWGPDATASAGPDDAAIAGFFPDDDYDADAVPLVSAPSGTVPWWADSKVRTAVAIAVVVILVTGGLAMAVIAGGNDDEADDVATGPTMVTLANGETTVGSAAVGAVTTTARAATPAPTGLPPVPPTTGSKKTTTTKKGSTPTTKKPATGSKPPTTNQAVLPDETTNPDGTDTSEEPTTTESTISADANLEWANAMRGTYEGRFIPDAGAPDTFYPATMQILLDTDSRRIYFKIDVAGADSTDFDLVQIIDGNPRDLELPIDGAEASGFGTPYGILRLWEGGDRVLHGLGTAAPGTGADWVSIDGPLDTGSKRLEVVGRAGGEGGAEVFRAVYDFNG